MKKVIICLMVLLTVICPLAYTESAELVSPEQPPEIHVTINGEEIPYIIGLNLWDGAIYDREDTFHSLLKNNPDLPVFEIGSEIVISFPSPEQMPDVYELRDYLLNPNGDEKYNRGETDPAVPIVFIEGPESEMTASITLEEHPLRPLSSLLDDYLPGASIRGFRLNCVWDDGNACEYAFVFRV